MSNDFSKLLQEQRGYDVFAKKEEEYEERQKSFVNRFWLPPEKSTKIVFLDDNPVILDEHQVKIDGRWNNFFTCLRQLGQNCPLCEELDNRPATTGFYTIIDTSEWTDARGNKHVNEKKLFAPKFKTLQMLKRLSKKRGSLQGCVFDVYRTSADAYNVGDVFDYEGKLEEAQIKKLNKDIVPFDYAEILKPQAAGDLLRLLKRNAENTNTEDYDVYSKDAADDINF